MIHLIFTSFLFRQLTLLIVCLLYIFVLYVYVPQRVVVLNKYINFRKIHVYLYLEGKITAKHTNIGTNL
jgi:hypothetical protein